MKCRVCYREHVGDLAFSMRPMPLAGQFCVSRDAALDAICIPLNWFQCSCCGLVQVLEDIDDASLYSAYNYASSTIPGVVRHFQEYAAWMVSVFGEAPLAFLEIGCNDGVLLRHLPETWRRVGVDPSDVASRAHSGDYKFVGAGFTEQLGASLGVFDVISASNCLAHISDLGDVLRGVWRCLKATGTFLMEVHDLDATLRQGQWDTIYHEHKAEWSVRSLARVGDAFGFVLEEITVQPFHGGLLRARFRKAARACGFLGDATRDSFDHLRVAYERRRDTDAYRRIASIKKPLAAYGAAGRANVWFNQMQDLAFAYVVDDSPLRQGKWLPAVAIPVVSREELLTNPLDACVITAWNYADDIRTRNPDYKGLWLSNMEISE